MPTPAPDTLDALAARLRARREEAGAPSFAEIAQRIGVRRRRAAVDGDRSAPARSTVYDCFRDGRRRIDVPLLLEIVAALGAEPAEIALWRSWCASLQGEPRRGPAVLTSFAGLPDRAAPFVAPGRQLGRLKDIGGAVLVSGMPGVGKTQLASAALAGRIAAGRVRQALTVDVRGSDPASPPADQGVVLDALARHLGLDANDSLDVVQRARAIGEELARTQTAVLLDDVADARQFDALARSAGSALMATSRSSAALPRGVTLVEVTPWAEEATIALLEAHLGAARVAEEPEAARALAAHAGGLPLAASLMAARLARADGWSLSDHRDRIQADVARLHVEDGVHIAFARSYEALGVEQRRALRLLATQPCSSLPTSAVAELLDRAPSVSDALLSDLRAAHVVEPGERVGMHRLVRLFAASRSWDEEPRRVRDDAIDRLVDAYLREAEGADPSWTAREMGPLVDLAFAVSSRRVDALIAVTAAVSDQLDAHGMFRTAEALQRRAYEATLQGASDDARMTAALALGRTLVRRSSPRAEAVLTEALAWAESADASAEAASAANSLAVLASMRGDLRGALARFQASLDWAKRAGRTDHVTRLHDNIGISLRRLGDLEGARTHHEMALALADEAGDDMLALTVLVNLSEVLLLTGDVAAAIEAASTAVQRGEVTGDFWLADALNNLGRAMSVSGSTAEALAHHDRALRLARATGSPALIAAVYSGRGQTQADAGDLDAARGSFHDAYDAARDAGVRFEQAKALVGLAEQDAHQEAVDDAVRRAREALSLLSDDGGPEGRRARAVLDRLSRVREPRG